MLEEPLSAVSRRCSLDHEEEIRASARCGRELPAVTFGREVRELFVTAAKAVAATPTPAPVPAKVTTRVKVEVGSVHVGDTLRDGRIVTGLGKSWVEEEQVRDDTACAHGMQPGLDWYPVVRTAVQYAYCG